MWRHIRCDESRLNMNLRKYALQIAAVAVLLLSALLIFLPSAKADGPISEPTPTDPYFREEAPERMVECGNNVFVPLGEGGTWECPSGQEQLPGEVLGRQVDCPDGSVGRIINMDLETTCEEVPGAYPSLSQPEVSAPVARTTPDFSPGEYGLIVAGLLLTAAGTLYMIYRKQPGQG